MGARLLANSPKVLCGGDQCPLWTQEFACSDKESPLTLENALVVVGRQHNTLLAMLQWAHQFQACEVGFADEMSRSQRSSHDVKGTRDGHDNRGLGRRM